MSLNNPQVQFVCLRASGQDDKKFLYVTTHLDRSDYEADGIISLTGPDSGGCIFVDLQLKRVGVALRLNKPVVHQINLDELSGTINQVEVNVWYDSAVLATTIVSQEESETIIRPIGENPLIHN